MAQDEKRKKKSRQMRVLRRFQRAGGKIGDDGVYVRNHMGAKKRRRVENGNLYIFCMFFKITFIAHMILNLADKDDICEDYSDLVPHTITAFTRLFMDKTSMKMWQSFMEKSEEEQEKYIEELDQGDASTANEDDEYHVIGGKTIKLPKGYDMMTNEEKRNCKLRFWEVVI